MVSLKYFVKCIIRALGLYIIHILYYVYVCIYIYTLVSHDLMCLSCDPQVVLEAVKLAVALLKGGHREVQESFWRHLSRPSSEDFFKEIHLKFQEAQAEIKNSPVGRVITQEVRVGWAWSKGG